MKKEAIKFAEVLIKRLVVSCIALQVIYVYSQVIVNFKWAVVYNSCTESNSHSKSR